jgi:hypothetical protein
MTSSLKNDVNVQKEKSNKNLIFYWRLESHWRKEQDPDPDPYQNATDPEG